MEDWLIAPRTNQGERNQTQKEDGLLVAYAAHALRHYINPKSRRFVLALERAQITDSYIQQISCCTILTNIMLSIYGFLRDETPLPVI